MATELSNAQLAQQISDMVTLWRNRELEFKAWLSGVAGGGPSSDGKYPLTDYLGNQFEVDSPAQWSADIASLTTSGTGAVDTAAASATAAGGSSTTAATSATAAAASATAAAASATTAGNSETISNANKIATYNYWQATLALNGTISTNAAAAVASAVAALASKNAAATSETNAATSASSAAASASAASGSASAASASAAAASASATSAGTSASTATTQASAASASASAASTSAAAALASKNAAATSETNAATSAGSASTSASTATTKAATATTQATNAAASAAAAAASAAAAATFVPALYATLSGATFTGTVTIPKILTTSGSGSGTNALIQPAVNQQLYSILGAPLFGPGIEARWDSSTVNRYLAFGYYGAGGAGPLVENFRIQGSATTWAAGQAVGIGIAPDSTLFVLNATSGASLRIAYSGTADNYYDASLHHFRDISGTPLLSLNTTYTSATYNSAGYSSGAFGVAGVILNNTNTSMQTAIEFQKNGAFGGRIRNDYVGGMAYVASGGGTHNFFTGGDSGAGANTFVIGSGYFSSNIWYNPAQTQYLQMASASGQSYGSLRVGGATGGQVGIELFDNDVNPTLMIGGGVAGMYLQGRARWAFYDYDTGGYFGVTLPILDLTSGAYYARNAVGAGTIRAQSGGSASGGVAGDIIFIY